MPAVRIEDDAFGDTRYDRLAQECGLADADHARGKMARLWRQCTAEGRYQLDRADVELVLGPNAVAGLTAARLGVPAGQTVRIRGTKGRIEWLQKLRDNGRKGGRPKKTKREPSGSGESNPPALVTAPAPAPAPSPDGEVGFDAARHTPTDPVQTEIDTRGGIIPFPTPEPPPSQPQIASTSRSAAPGRTRSAKLADSPHFAAAHRLWTRQENARRALNPRTRHLDLTGNLGVERLKRVIDRMNDGWTEEQLAQVVDSFAARSKSDPEQMQWFNGDTNWRKDNVDREYGKLGAPRNLPPRVSTQNPRDVAGGTSRTPTVAETPRPVTLPAEERAATAAHLADLRSKGLAPG